MAHFVGCVALLSVAIDGHALAGDAPDGKEPKGWEKIIVRRIPCWSIRSPRRGS